jgi:hypothetical protein
MVSLLGSRSDKEDPMPDPIDLASLKVALASCTPRPDPTHCPACGDRLAVARRAVPGAIPAIEVIRFCPRCE